MQIRYLNEAFKMPQKKTHGNNADYSNISSLRNNMICKFVADFILDNFNGEPDIYFPIYFVGIADFGMSGRPDILPAISITDINGIETVTIKIRQHNRAGLYEQPIEVSTHFSNKFIAFTDVISNLRNILQREWCDCMDVKLLTCEFNDIPENTIGAYEIYGSADIIESGVSVMFPTNYITHVWVSLERISVLDFEQSVADNFVNINTDAEYSLVLYKDPSTPNKRLNSLKSVNTEWFPIKFNSICMGMDNIRKLKDGNYKWLGNKFPGLMVKMNGDFILRGKINLKALGYIENFTDGDITAKRYADAIKARNIDTIDARAILWYPCTGESTILTVSRNNGYPQLVSMPLYRKRSYAKKYLSANNAN